MKYNATNTQEKFGQRSTAEKTSLAQFLVHTKEIHWSSSGILGIASNLEEEVFVYLEQLLLN